MKKKVERKPIGLAGKLIRFVIIFVLCMGAAFAIMSFVQVSLLKKVVKSEEFTQTYTIQTTYAITTASVPRDSLYELITWAADKTDDEFWILDHDIRILGEMVEDVFMNPENYECIPVLQPQKENGGKYALQILYPEGEENADPETIEMMERLANLAPMMEEIVEGNEGYTMDFAIAAPDGISVFMDDRSDLKLDENGNPINYDPRHRPWFEGAIEKAMYTFPRR